MNQSGRWYADPDSTVYFIAAAGLGDTIIGEVSISGYLIAEDDPSLAP